MDMPPPPQPAQRYALYLSKNPTVEPFVDNIVAYQIAGGVLHVTLDTGREWVINVSAFKMLRLEPVT